MTETNMHEIRSWLLERTADINITLVQADIQATANATKALINNLIFQESKSTRTSTIVLAAFNVFAATLTAGSILYDCYWASKRASTGGRCQTFCVSKIHPAETFPLILSLGIIIQGITFASAQSFGLSATYTEGCGTMAQIVFPAIFFVPYIQLVFGIECVLRSLRSLPFQSRGKYDVTICLLIVLLMTIGTWVPTFLDQEEDECFASLVWFVTKYAVEGLVLTSIIGGLVLSFSALILYRCSTCSLIDQHQRIAASRMVYYMFLSFVSVVFVIPWFASLFNGDPSSASSTAAAVVMNLSGIIFGALHLFLRANTVATSFGPKIEASWGKRKHELRIWGPNELGFNGHLAEPIEGPRTNSRSGLIRDQKTMSVSSQASSMIQEETNNGQPIHSPVNTEKDLFSPGGTSKPFISPRNRATQKFSLFPQEAVSPFDFGGRLPATTFSPISALAAPSMPANVFGHRAGDGLESIYIAADLEPPPRVLADGIRGHARNSSTLSSATLPFGLRMSNMDLFDNDIENSAVVSSPSTAAPLRVQTQGLQTVPSARSTNELPQSPPQQRARNNSNASIISTASLNKHLPLVPRRVSAILQDDLPVFQLSPTVYTPGASASSPNATSPSSPATIRSQTVRVGLPSRPTPSSPRQALMRQPLPGSPQRLQGGVASVIAAAGAVASGIAGGSGDTRVGLRRMESGDQASQDDTRWI